MIAPYWADSDNYYAFRKEQFTGPFGEIIEVDELQASNVYYQLHTSGSLLTKAAADVGAGSVEWVVVITWVNIYPYINDFYSGWPYFPLVRRPVTLTDVYRLDLGKHLCLKRRPHDQIFTLASFPCRHVLFARVDGKKGGEGGGAFRVRLSTFKQVGRDS